jgi:hypothetical protein
MYLRENKLICFLDFYLLDSTVWDAAICQGMTCAYLVLPH